MIKMSPSVSYIEFVTYMRCFDMLLLYTSTGMRKDKRRQTLHAVLVGLQSLFSSCQSQGLKCE